ncbi:hypothetical protein RB213_012548 [Colletotrichum asianum]
MLLSSLECCSNTTRSILVHWQTIIRNILAIVTMATAILLVTERAKHGFEDNLWRSLWCFSVTGNCLFCFVWARMSRQPKA